MNPKISTTLSNLLGIEKVLRRGKLDFTRFQSLIMIILQLLRSIFIDHRNLTSKNRVLIALTRVAFHLSVEKKNDEYFFQLTMFAHFECCPFVLLTGYFLSQISVIFR